jgi:hypothetical protein
MLKLPFYVDSPLADAAVALGVSLVFGYLYLAQHKNYLRFGDGLNWIFQRRFSAFAPERAIRIGRHLLLTMTAISGTMALFNILVCVGLLRNGDPPKPITMEEFMQRHGSTTRR